AVTTSLPAVDGDDEQALSSCLVIGIGVGAIQEDLVLDGNGVELASAGADKGLLRLSFLLWLDTKTTALSGASGRAERYLLALVAPTSRFRPPPDSSIVLLALPHHSDGNHVRR